jgi:hypothetical protein
VWHKNFVRASQITTQWLETATAARHSSLTEKQRTEFEVNNEEGNDSEDNVDIDEDDL